MKKLITYVLDSETEEYNAPERVQERKEIMEQYAKNGMGIQA